MSSETLIDWEASEELSMGEYWAAFKRRFPMFGIVALGVFGVALIAALVIPAEYEARAVILIEQQEIPQDLVRSTVTSYADQRIQTISQRVMTTSNLLSIIEKYDLYGDELKTNPAEVVLAIMREDIDIRTISADVVDPRSGRPVEATIAFTIRYQNETPRLTQNVTNDLASLFLDENLKTRTEMAMETTEFLEEESGKLAAKIDEFETRIAQFKQDHAGQLPELEQVNFKLQERIESEISSLQGTIRALEQRRIYLNSELAQLDPHTTFYTEGGERILSTRNQYRVLEAKLLELKSRYSDEHPSVIRTQRELDALKGGDNSSNMYSELVARRKEASRELDALLDEYGAANPKVRAAERKLATINQELSRTSVKDAQESTEPDNPSYIQIESQIKSVASEIGAAQISLNALKAKRADLEEDMLAMPLVEKDYRELLRNYENTIAEYQDIRQKQHDADLSRALEEGRKGERFTLIEPPLLPEKPVRPNRPLIIAIGFVMAVIAGLGCILLVESVDSTVYGIKALRTVTGSAPLAAIPVIETGGDIKKRRIAWGVKVLGLFAIILVALAAFHVFVRPLDIAWLVFMRKIGF